MVLDDENTRLFVMRSPEGNRKASSIWYIGRAEVEKARIRRQFYRRFGVPGVTGVIDGTHCRIQRPRKEKKT
ncbi:hypothetical protein OSTOST_10369, partial [Ostertagia ostertagi]